MSSIETITLEKNTNFDDYKNKEGCWPVEIELRIKLVCTRHVSQNSIFPHVLVGQ